MSTENLNTGAQRSGNLDNEFSQPQTFTGRLWRRITYENPVSFKNWKGLPGFWDVLKWKFGSDKYPGTPSEEVLNKELPVRSPDFSNTTGLKATWLGHATVLVQMDGINFITDPVFAPRASPFGFAGPRRYRPPPCKIENLPDLAFAVISHNHYDHLDAKAVVDLNRKFPEMLWYVPQGLKNWMKDTVPRAKVHELTWGESIQHQKENTELNIICVPAQHWSLRGVLDKNTSLWSGWAVLGPKFKFYYTGDTGFCDDEFRKLGEKHGPFQLAAIPIGCYSPRDFMKGQHINTEEAVEIHRLVKAEFSMGIHWGTYEMGSTEPYKEPPELFMKSGEKAKEKYQDEIGKVFILDHGETWTYQKPKL